VSSML